MKTAHGFTLIELLVVIAIIGLLSSVVMSSLNSARGKGQEAKRKGDMHSLIQGIALYRNDHTEYPPLRPALPGGCTSSTCVANMGQDLVPKYMPALPADPVKKGTDVDYRYCRGSNTNQYALLRYSQLTNSWCSVPTPAPITNTACWHANGVPQYPVCK